MNEKESKTKILIYKLKLKKALKNSTDLELNILKQILEQEINKRKNNQNDNRELTN